MDMALEIDLNKKKKGPRMSDLSTAVDPALLQAGAAVSGSLVAQLLNTKTVTVRRMCGLGLAGSLTGIFCSPAISDLLTVGPTNQHLRLFVGLSVGLLGVALATLIMLFAETTSFPAFVARLMGIQLPPEVGGGK